MRGSILFLHRELYQYHVTNRHVCQFGIETQFCSHNHTEIGCFTAMHEAGFVRTKAETHTSPPYTSSLCRPWIPSSITVRSPISITCSSICLRVFHHLFNTGRVDTSIGNQSFANSNGPLHDESGSKEKAGWLPAYHQQSGQHRSCFNRTDVTAFTTNNLAFDFVWFQVEYAGNRILNGLFSHSTLDRLNHNLTGFFIRLCLLLQ